MTDNQPDKESLSVLPIDAAQKSARDAPKGLRHVKPSNQPTELTWAVSYEGMWKTRKEGTLWDRFLCRIGWHRYEVRRDIKRFAKRIEAREASK